MFKFIFSIIAVCLLIVLCGCDRYSIDLVEQSEPFMPKFNLSKGDGAMPVSTIGVFDSNTKEIMWEVVKPTVLSEITYGKVPYGMEVSINAKTLKINTLYSITCLYGDYGAIVQFMIVEKDKNLMVIKVE